MSDELDSERNDALRSHVRCMTVLLIVLAFHQCRAADHLDRIGDALERAYPEVQKP